MLNDALKWRIFGAGVLAGAVVVLVFQYIGPVIGGGQDPVVSQEVKVPEVEVQEVLTPDQYYYSWPGWYEAYQNYSDKLKNETQAQIEAYERFLERQQLSSIDSSLRRIGYELEAANRREQLENIRNMFEY